MELLNGIVAQNIARMKVEFSPEMVVEAAKNAGAHEMISRLPQGYETDKGLEDLIYLVDKDKGLHLQEHILVIQNY